MCRLGDLEVSDWSDLVMQLIHQKGEKTLFQNLSEFMNQRSTIKTAWREREIQALFASRIFDDEKWVLFVEFNRQYRPEHIVSEHMAVILPDCCGKPGVIPKVQLPSDKNEKRVCCPHCGAWTTYACLETMKMEDIDYE